jgi:hypothetical protein
MAFTSNHAVMDGSRMSAADLSAEASQFTFVKLDAAGKVVQCDAATDVPYGVLLNAPAVGQTAQVGIIGIFKVRADAALATPGTLIGPSADGQADAKVPGTDATEYVVGVTVETSGGAGELIACVINCAAPSRAA